MDAKQFNQFIQAFQNAIVAAIQATLQAQVPPQQQANRLATPKISVKIPTYRGDPKENVMIWLLQVQNLFMAQNLEDEGTQIHYATSGFEGVALYWFLNKVTAAGEEVAFDTWENFARELQGAFQPPNF